MLDVPHAGAAPRGGAARAGAGLPRTTAPTSSPAVWAASGCSSPRRWPQAGCGRIVLSSRSQPTPKALETIELMRRDRVPTSWWSAATSPNPAPRERLVAAATATGLPLRGVLHAAAVFEDATLANITEELIDRDWAPKVHGAWNLHQATAESAAGLVLLVLLGGRAGGLARAGRVRRGQQLAGRIHPLAPHPGPARHRDRVGLGEVGGAEIGRRQRLSADGEGATNASLRRRRRLRIRGAVASRPHLHRATRRSRVRRGWPPSRSAASSLKRSDPGGKANGHKQLRAELTHCPPDEWPARLRRLISEQVGLILRRSIDPDRPLSEYGLDSLGNLELRTRIEAETGIRITPTTSPPFGGLADHPVRKAGIPNGTAGNVAWVGIPQCPTEPQVLD